MTADRPGEALRFGSISTQRWRDAAPLCGDAAGLAAVDVPHDTTIRLGRLEEAQAGRGANDVIQKTSTRPSGNDLRSRLLPVFFPLRFR